MLRTGRWVVALLGPAALVAGCGESHHPIGTRPAEPITVSALIDSSQVKVSPTKFGAGPVMVLVSNQSGRPQRLTFESEASGPGMRATTMVPLDGTAQLQVSPGRGRYRLAVHDRRVRPASMRVGKPRPSAQEQLLRP